MLHCGRIGCLADRREQRFPGFALSTENSHLNQFVGVQATNDLLQYRRREAFLADDGYWVQAVGTGAQFAALRGGKNFHGQAIQVGERILTR